MLLRIQVSLLQRLHQVTTLGARLAAHVERCVDYMLDHNSGFLIRMDGSRSPGRLQEKVSSHQNIALRRRRLAEPE